MRRKNSKPFTEHERAHLAVVKQLPCAWCGGHGGYAHHIRQGDHFTCVATCWDCHQGPQGIHGDQTLMRIYKRDELQALNQTLRNAYASDFA